MIVSGGENIASPEVERWGEVPVALVVRRPGATVAGDELREFCLARLAKFKVPRAVHFR